MTVFFDLSKTVKEEKFLPQPREKRHFLWPSEKAKEQRDSIETAKRNMLPPGARPKVKANQKVSETIGIAVTFNFTR